jgi:hypothetical protein
MQNHRKPLFQMLSHNLLCRLIMVAVIKFGFYLYVYLIKPLRGVFPCI